MNLTKSSSKSLDFDGVAFDSFSACCLNLFRIFLPPSSTFCDVFLYHLEWVVVVLVTQSFLTLCNPMDCSPPSSSIHGILQARILQWVAISFSRGSSQCRDWTWVSQIAERFFIIWVIREAKPPLFLAWYITISNYCSPFHLCICVSVA